jgi:hypothetical protein
LHRGTWKQQNLAPSQLVRYGLEDVGGSRARRVSLRLNHAVSESQARIDHIRRGIAEPLA